MSCRGKLHRDAEATTVIAPMEPSPKLLKPAEIFELLTEGEWAEWQGVRIVCHPKYAPHKAKEDRYGNLTLDPLDPMPAPGTPLRRIENPYL